MDLTTIDMRGVGTNDASSDSRNILYTKGEVQRAGETLIIPDISTSDPARYAQAMKILSYWRSCHIFPLDRLASKLQADALKINKKSITAKRLKRTPSIISKLTRFRTMKLRNMQDIGGCRVIVGTSKHVQKLKRELNRDRHFKVTDYIESPKDDGYRGIHLVGKFSAEDRKSEYLIEVQLRSAVQHSWATAVEIIDLFTNQALKSDVGSQDWKDFFKSTSVELAILEGDVSTGDENAAEEVVRLSKKLNVFQKFEAYRSSLKILSDSGTKDEDGYFLLRIDTKKNTLSFDFYNLSGYQNAAKDYLSAEKSNVKNPQTVVALVSSSSINDLKEAYPNYFADSDVFVTHLVLVLEKYKEKNPNWFKKFLLETPRRQ